MGTNPTHVLHGVVYRAVRDNILRRDRPALFVVNLVGFSSGPHSAFVQSNVVALRRALQATCGASGMHRPPLHRPRLCLLTLCASARRPLACTAPTRGGTLTCLRHSPSWERTRLRHTRRVGCVQTCSLGHGRSLRRQSAHPATLATRKSVPGTGNAMKSPGLRQRMRSCNRGCGNSSRIISRLKCGPCELTVSARVCVRGADRSVLALYC